MQKVYIVQVRGWGDDENSMYNVAAFSTRDQAHAHIAEIREEHEDADVDVDVMTVDA
jgi:tartrate dehydratase beta subunit/fumarate hydratase class I family protein